MNLTIRIFSIYWVYYVIGESFATLINEGNCGRARCARARSSEMLCYACSNLNLTEIPQNLISSMVVGTSYNSDFLISNLTVDIGVLDISVNRIRELNVNSFARYNTLKELSLMDNLIQTIGPNTFAQLTCLEAIDLSNNGLTSLPMEIFSLPLLRYLHAMNNPLVNLDEDMKTVPKPLSAPLQWINIGSCKLNKVPDFGILPDLHRLTIMSNDLIDITPQQLSPFCGLTSIDVNNTQIPPCPCLALLVYFERRSISLPTGVSCGISFESILAEPIDCSDTSTADSDQFDHCMTFKNEKRMQFVSPINDP